MGLLLWDLLFSQFHNVDHDNNTKQMINLTKLMIHLIKNKLVTLNILKGIKHEDWNNSLYISSNGKLCLTLLFTKLLELPYNNYNDNNHNNIKYYITNGISKNEEGDSLKQSIYYFLINVMKYSPKMINDSSNNSSSNEDNND